MDFDANQNQWLFPLESLARCPSELPLPKQLDERSKGVEFLFRLGSSLGLPTPAMFTAATWFHRFYMRFATEDFHRQDVAAACIFLATKTEECGRKLRDVAKICYSKTANMDVNDVPNDSKEVDKCQAVILTTEEALLEALCFDFIVESPHAELVQLFVKHQTDSATQECAWSLAHDSYRTPLCVLYTPQIIAAVCYVLAQRVVGGPNSPSLDSRISSASPSSSLPTPPSHKPASPDASRLVIEHYAFSDGELQLLAEALSILLEFFGSQDQSIHPYLSSVTTVQPPTSSSNSRPRIYGPLPEAPIANIHEQPSLEDIMGRTPSSSHGGQSPAKSVVNGDNLVPLQS
ncbi:cyclin-like protein [Mycena floridula]|nr:cyclin-like protein [Mycena floridula]